MSKQLTPELTRELKDPEFETRIAQSKGLVLVDFWAEWCGPCKSLAPVVDELARDHEGSVAVFKVDVDANPESPSRYGVRGIPTLLLFKDGVAVDRIVGNQPREVIESAIRRNL